MKVVSLLSGGMDSSVLAFHLRREGHEVLPLAFIYGQRHSREVNAAKTLCQFSGFRLEVANIKNLQSFLSGGSSLTNPDIPVPEGHYADETMKATIVPNRNMIMLAIAGAYAITQGAEAIAIAAHAGDHAIYPDCRPEFHNAVGRAFELCDYRPLTLLRPFIDLTKDRIAALGHQLDVPFSMTWSCYKGGELHCGKCGTCVERKEAFELAGLIDPTFYAGEDGKPPQVPSGGGSLTLGG